MMESWINNSEVRDLVASMEKKSQILVPNVDEFEIFDYWMSVTPVS